MAKKSTASGLSVYHALASLPQHEKDEFWELIIENDDWIDSPLLAFLRDTDANETSVVMKLLHEDSVRIKRDIENLKDSLISQLSSYGRHMESFVHKGRIKHPERARYIFDAKAKGQSFAQIADDIFREHPEWYEGKEKPTSKDMHQTYTRTKKYFLTSK